MPAPNAELRANGGPAVLAFSSYRFLHVRAGTTLPVPAARCHRALHDSCNARLDAVVWSWPWWTAHWWTSMLPCTSWRAGKRACAPGRAFFSADRQQRRGWERGRGKSSGQKYPSRQLYGGVGRHGLFGIQNRKSAVCAVFFMTS
jgi:hypothetical protein